MKYRIITSHNAEKLEEAVNKHLGDNWEPIGGVSVIGYDGSPRSWSQAIVRRDISHKTLSERFES